jgi:HD-like signal output (HDOD) protein
MAQTDLKSLVERIYDLPTLPEVIAAVNRLLDDPESSASDLNGVIGRDPALATRILRIVNSPFYGLPNKISSIGQAVVILGFSTVRSLAISASVLEVFGPGAGGFDYAAFWKHQIGCAVVCETLGRRQPGVNPDTAFVLGLTHDLGKLILDQYAHDALATVLKRAADGELPFEEAEREVLQASHAEVGYWLAERWAFPEELARAIRHQHAPDLASDGTSARLAAVCAFARYVCRLKSYGADGSCGKPELPAEAWGLLGFDREDLPGLIASIHQELPRADAFCETVLG